MRGKFLPKNITPNTDDVTCYPKFLENKPCGEDLFEGGSHKNIAINIKKLILSNDESRVIGIDGGWGTGKSNLIKLVKKELEEDIKSKDKYHFFEYDAWGFQTDLQRRSILENLTSFIVEKIPGINKSKWKGRLHKLLSRRRSASAKTVKELSAISKVASILSIFTPLFLPILINLDDRKNDWGIWGVCIIIFVVTLVSTYRLQVKNMKKYGQETSFKNVLHEVFYSYLDYRGEESVEDLLKYETIFEEEPSSRDFKSWVYDINEDLKSLNQNLIIVFDNMDRLPKNKVQELWAAIHTFFAEESYTNIHVIIPFDREHIKTAFKAENIDLYGKDCSESNKSFSSGINEISYGNDFINKTFNVVYRVSPPTMSNWKGYFRTLWIEAFGEDSVLDESITQVYDLLTDNHTPRKIIAFINEFVSIKQILSNETIPGKYIAIYILRKHEISLDPTKEILSPSYLGSLSFLYGNDQELPKYMSALYYQLPVDKALDLIYTNRLRHALDNGDVDQIKSIQKLSIFPNLLENAVVSITNTENATLSLNECLNSNSVFEKNIWKCVWKSLKGKHEESLQDYQTILLAKIPNKTEQEQYLKDIINGLYSSQTFDATTFYKNINSLKEATDINPLRFLKNKSIEPQDFLKYVSVSGEDYKTCRIDCDCEKLDGYLSRLNVDELSNVSCVKYFISEYNLANYKENIKTLINQNTNSPDALRVLYNRLKEIECPVDHFLQDSVLYTLIKSIDEEDEFYIDLVCMRIAKLSSFNTSYESSFSKSLSSTEDVWVRKVAEQVECYIGYGEILKNASTMNYPLYKEIIKKLTDSPNSNQRLNIYEVLQTYHSIRDCIQELNPQSLLKNLASWEKDAVSQLTVSNINTISSVFFEDALSVNNGLTKHCIQTAKQYLDTLTTDNWKKAITTRNYDYGLMSVLNYDTQHCFDAFKSVVEECSLNRKVYLTPDTYCELKVVFKNRSFVNFFKAIRDLYCSGKATMSQELFNLIGEDLLQFGSLEEKDESLRTIFVSSLLDDSNVVDILLKYNEKVGNIVKNTSFEEAQDFIDKLRVVYPSYKEDERMDTLFSYSEIDIPSNSKSK